MLKSEEKWNTLDYVSSIAKLLLAAGRAMFVQRALGGQLTGDDDTFICNENSLKFQSAWIKWIPIVNHGYPWLTMGIHG